MAGIRPPLVVTPGILGEDGISCLSRQVVQALNEIAGGEAEAPHVWSWGEANGSSPSDPPGVRLFRAGRNPARLLSWAAGEALRPQNGRLLVVLHAHLGPAVLPIVARGARLLQLLIGVEVWKPLTPLQRRALRSASRLVGISHHTVAQFKRANPDFSGAETVVCHPGLPRRDRAATAASSSDGAVIVGRIAASERYKGHDALLEIWREVRQRVPTARLTILGDGDDRARLESKARALSLGGSVVFEGHVSSEQLEGHYRGSRFMVMPSTLEGFGFVFLEAMRQGLPVVAGPGAASEIVEEGRTGFVVDPNDRARLMEVVVRLYRDEKLRSAMGEQARARFERNFTSDHFRERLRRVLPDASGT